jgi:hypothetical protein
MSGFEALQAMKQGKKIRMTKWPDGAYMEYGYTWVLYSPALCWFYFRNVDCPQEAQYKIQEIFHDIMKDDDWEIVDNRT